MTTAIDAGVAMFSCPAPPWANEPTEWWNGSAEHSRFARRSLDVSGWLQQYDELDVTDGVLTLVRQPATIAVEFDGIGDAAYNGDMYPIDQWRGGWMPELPEHITAERSELARDAVAELLGVHDAAAV